MNTSDLIMQEIMVFTEAVVSITENGKAPIPVRAKAIMMAETILHELIMSKIITKCADASVPSAN